MTRINLVNPEFICKCGAVLSSFQLAKLNNELVCPNCLKTAYERAVPCNTCSKFVRKSELNSNNVCITCELRTNDT